MFLVVPEVIVWADLASERCEPHCFKFRLRCVINK